MFQCVKKSGFSLVAIYLTSDDQSLNQESIQAVYNAKNAGLDVHLWLTLCAYITP